MRWELLYRQKLVFCSFLPPNPSRPFATFILSNTRWYTLIARARARTCAHARTHTNPHTYQVLIGIPGGCCQLLVNLFLVVVALLLALGLLLLLLHRPDDVGGGFERLLFLGIESGSGSGSGSGPGPGSGSGSGPGSGSGSGSGSGPGSGVRFRTWARVLRPKLHVRRWCYYVSGHSLLLTPEASHSKTNYYLKSFFIANLPCCPVPLLGCDQVQIHMLVCESVTFAARH